LTVTLAADSGTLMLAATAGLTFLDGTVNGGATLTFSGTAADVNAALNGLAYTPGPGYRADGATLSMTVDDPGSLASGRDTASASIGISTDGPPPELTVPGDTTAVAKTPVTFQVTASSAAGIASVEWLFKSAADDDYQADPGLTGLTATKTFAAYGGYDVLVRVTDNNGQESESGFRLNVAEAPVSASVTVAGPVDEGYPGTFTAQFATPDATDSVSVYADWTGSGDFRKLDTSDWTNNGNGSFTFTHVYHDTTGATPSYATKFRFENDGGAPTTVNVPVTVREVPLTFTLTAGKKIGSAADVGFDFWRLTDDASAGATPQVVAFANVVDPARGDTDATDTLPGLKFHWRLTDATGKPVAVPDTKVDAQGFFTTDEETLELPDMTFGKVYWVDAYASDNDGRSATQTIAVVVGTNDPQVASQDLYVLEEPYQVNVFDYGLQRLGIAGNSAVVYNWDGSNPPDPGAQPGLGFAPGVVTSNALSTTISENDALTVHFRLDSYSEAVAKRLGYAISYTYHVTVRDVEQHTLGSNSNRVLTTGVRTTASDTITVGGLNGGLGFADGTGGDGLVGFNLDREIDVDTSVTFSRNGQVFATLPGHTVFAYTPQTPTTGQEISQALEAVKSLVPQFGSAAASLLDAVTNHAQTFFDTLVAALRGAANQVAGDPVGTLRDVLFGWLNASGVGTNIQVDLSKPNALATFLVQYAGLTGDRIQQLVLQQLGARGAAALEPVVAQLFGKSDADPNSVGGVTAFLDNLSKLGVGFTWSDLQAKLEKEAEGILKDGWKGAAAQLAAKFVPGVGLFKALYDGLTWLLANKDSLSNLFTTFTSSIPQLAGGQTAQATQSFVNAIKGMGATVLGALAAQVGLANLPRELKRVTQFVPDAVAAAVKTAVTAAVTKLLPATSSTTKMYDGLLSPIIQFSYQKVDYVLWVAQKGSGTPKVFVAPKGAAKPIGALTAASFSNNEKATKATTDIANLITAAQKYAADVKAAGKKGAKASAIPLSQLTREQKDLGDAAAQVVKDIKNDACKVLNAGCFAAGTKLWTPEGYRAVEDLVPGDVVYARSEYNPEGPVAGRVVEAKFERTGCVLHLHFAGDRLIRTTPEHPFYVEGKGWTAAGALAGGERLRTAWGWAELDEAFDTNCYERVYNLRVAEDHTYFVGEEEWGFAVWAHNACFDVGLYASLPSDANFPRHHVPQVRAGKYTWDDDYDPNEAPAIIIPLWMHQQVDHLTGLEFEQHQNADIVVHIRYHLKQLLDFNVPRSKVAELKRLIEATLDVHIGPLPK
jgi:hypothetical protein